MAILQAKLLAGKMKELMGMSLSAQERDKQDK